MRIIPIIFSLMLCSAPVHAQVLTVPSAGDVNVNSGVVRWSTRALVDAPSLYAASTTGTTQYAKYSGSASVTPEMYRQMADTFSNICTTLLPYRNAGVLALWSKTYGFFYFKVRQGGADAHYYYANSSIYNGEMLGKMNASNITIDKVLCGHHNQTKTSR